MDAATTVRGGAWTLGFGPQPFAEFKEYPPIETSRGWLQGRQITIHNLRCSNAVTGPKSCELRVAFWSDGRVSACHIAEPGARTEVGSHIGIAEFGCPTRIEFE
jgi:hypothetical protein